MVINQNHIQQIIFLDHVLDYCARFEDFSHNFESELELFICGEKPVNAKSFLIDMSLANRLFLKGFNEVFQNGTKMALTNNGLSLAHFA